MEPFDIRSTPARIPPGQLVLMGLLFLFTLAFAVQAVFSTNVLLRADERSTTMVVLYVVLLLLLWLCVWLCIPQVLVLRRYYSEDRGKQVLTFRLDQEGWRWMQVGTDVLMPWDRLRLSVIDRTAEHFTVRFECAEPVLVGTDQLSRTVHRNLKHRRRTDVPFTNTDPTEEQLAAAIGAHSGGRVVLER